ncbi:Melanopsin [Hypsibius exemplaris]|uniref:Melanopsin n=1 Tax=Hypsibius exemplaris TaxID=2072580 RepID=A0A1W0WK05_HYPEX|nr:Melanopsin [Hypsibius exemplaris]
MVGGAKGGLIDADLNITHSGFWRFGLNHATTSCVIKGNFLVCRSEGINKLVQVFLLLKMSGELYEDSYPEETSTYNIIFAPEMKDLIPLHWYTFPQPSYVWHLTLAVIILILGVISISGNAAVIYIFCSTRGLRNPSNALIVNLAISDFAMMITMCPMYFLSSLQEKWIFGREACRFYGFCGALFGTVSIITIAAIAVDRYLVICKPFLLMRSTMTRERAKFAIAFVWLYSLGWAAPPLCGVSNYVLEGFLTTCSFDYLDPSSESRIFIFTMFIGAYVAPLSIIIISYLLIVYEVYAHSKKFKKAASKMKGKGAAQKQNDELAKKKKEIQTAKIACTITICWTAAWTPYAMVALMGIGSRHAWLSPILSQLPALCAKTAAVYNPLVYAISHPKYRDALKKIFPFLICIKSPDEEIKGTSSVGKSTRIATGNGSSRQSQSAIPDEIDSDLSVEEEELADDPVPKKRTFPVGGPSEKRVSLKSYPTTSANRGGEGAHHSPHAAIRAGPGPVTYTHEAIATYTKYPQPEVTLSPKGLSKMELHQLNTIPSNVHADRNPASEPVWQEKVTTV